ncbi:MULTISPECIES: S24/S26 family peptidase [unclassified Nocardioides]|uniref:S24/S26 family peptidase n=1 Tax=unclassified Nocardioides TaxID=2615069 RepID=UPI0009F0F73D|nr:MULTISPECIES: S24/S26 family peptidase [unclassified Nocardioides]GAW52165.1 peptidase S26B, signal peptidase [Nocardioides sp. PD653-B2]GAW55563.1 peptidase S26B, signal peptidase [Nocardioides sp. PD653]
MVELKLKTRRRRSWPRRLLSALGWAFSLIVLALSVPTPWGPPRLGVTVVSGHSMLPTYDPGDLVVTWRTASYPAGTPVVYNIPADQPGTGLKVVHRVVDVRPDGTHVTQGDNNDSVDPWQPRDDDIRGEVVLRVPRGGILLRWFGSPLVLAVVSGLLAGAWAFGRVSRGGDAPAPGGGARSRRSHRRRTPPGRMTMRVTVGVLTLAAAMGGGTARAADLGLLTADDITTTTVSAELAANPVSYEQHLTSETALQYCATVTVTNHSDQAVQWEITLNISGQPYNASSVASSYGVTTVSFQPDLWRVRGADYNAVIAAGGTYEWGYCGARSPTGLVDATVSVAVTQSDAQSYCATATVSTTSTDWIRWRATLNHATAGISDDAFWLAAEPTTTNSMTTVSFDAVTGTWVTRGVASNEYIRSGTNATFGYCAPSGAASPLVDATLSVSITSSDSQQYCASVTASTTSASYVKWKATITHSTPGLTNNIYWLTAVPTNLSNAATVSFDASTGTWVLQGLPYNQLIKAGSPATWGYCAPTNQSADLVDATVTVTRNGTSSTPGGQYCADVTVSTTSTDWVKWRAVLTQATPNLSGANYVLLTQPTNFWNATSIDFTSGVGTFQWRLRGVGWNDLIKAGSPQTFGFCR